MLKLTQRRSNSTTYFNIKTAIPIDVEILEPELEILEPELDSDSDVEADALTNLEEFNSDPESTNRPFFSYLQIDLVQQSELASKMAVETLKFFETILIKGYLIIKNYLDSIKIIIFFGF